MQTSRKNKHIITRTFGTVLTGIALVANMVGQVGVTQAAITSGSISINNGATYATSTSVILNLFATASGSATTRSFIYTGSATSTTVPAGITSMTVDMSGGGGAGGGDGYGANDGAPGDNGVRITGTFAVTSGEVLSIVTAGGGTPTPNVGCPVFGTGGYGQPIGGVGDYGCDSTATGGGGGGGGRSTIVSTSGGGRNGVTILAASGGDGGKGGDGDMTGGSGGSGATPNVLAAGTAVNGASTVLGGGPNIAGQNSTVTLAYFSASPASLMAFSTDGTNYSAYEAYATTKAYTLPAGDGTKTVYVKFKDAGGVESTPYSDTILLDTTAPTGYSITASPINNANKAAASFTFTGAEVGSTYTYIWTSGANKSGTGVVASTGQTISGIDLSTLSDGTSTLAVALTDVAGNKGATTTINVLKDTAGPTGSIVINSGATYASSTSVLLALSAIDGGNGGATTTTSLVYTGTPQSWLVPAGVTAVTVELAGAGGGGSGYDISLDGLGGDKVYGTLAVTPGTTLDIVVASGGGGGDQFGNGTGGGYGDGYGAAAGGYAGGGGGRSTITVHGGALLLAAAGGNGNTNHGTGGAGAGPTYANGLSVVSGGGGAGGFGDYSGGTSGELGWAMISPILPVVNSGVSQMAFSTDNVTYSTFESYTSSKTYTVPTTQGTTTVYVEYKDGLGNISSVYTDTIVLDTTTPTGYSVTASPINNANKAAASFTFTGAEVGSTYTYIWTSGANKSGTGVIASTGQTISGIDLSTLTDGTSTLAVSLTDAAGNKGATTTINIAKDVTTPTGYSITASPINNANKAAASFIFTGAEVGSTYIYIWTSGANKSGTGVIASTGQTISGIDLSTLIDGTSTLAVSLTDAAGNKGATSTINISKDVAAPTIASFSTSAFATSTTVTLNMSASDSGTGIANVLLSNDGSSYSTTTYATTKTWTLTAGDGSKTVYLKVVDNAGNTTAATSTTITLDTANPTGTISIPVYSTSTATLTLSGSDANGIANILLSNDGVSYASSTYATTKAWPLSAGDGAKTVNVKFLDNAGNLSSIYTATTTVDSTAPTGTITINAGEAIASSTAVTLTLSGSDALSGISQMQFSDDGSAWSGAEAYATTKAYTLPIGDGTKAVYVRYIDNAGNVSTTTNNTVLLDTSIPQLGTDSLLINGSSNLVQSNTADVTLSLQQVTGQPTGETVYAQFSHNGTDWFGANANGTLSANTWGTGFSSDAAAIAGLSWPWTLQSKSETIHVQIKDNIVDGVSTDTNQGTYNLAPVVSAVTASQQADATVTIQYSIHDLDNTAATTSLEYSTDGITWNPLDANITGQLGAVTVGSSDAQFVATWDGKTTLAGAYNASVFVRVSADDGELLNNTGRSTSTAFAVDAKAPSLTGLLIDGSATPIEAETPAVTLSIAGLTGYPTSEPVFAQFSRDGGTTWYGYVAGTTTQDTWGDSFITAPDFAWTLAGRSETLSLRLKDSYGNISNTVTNQATYNIRPEIDIVSTTQATSTGSLVTTFEVRDRDTFTNTVAPTYQYSTNGTTWNTIDPTQLSITDTSGVSAESLAVSSTYASYIATWNAKDQFPNALTNLSLKVTIDDGQPIKNTASATSSSVIIDAKAPTLAATSLLINDSSDIAVSSSKDITLKLQDVAAYPADEMIEARFSRDGGTIWSDWSAPFASDAQTLTSQSFPWTMAGRSETVTVAVRDLFGNEASSTDTNGAGYNLSPQIISGPIAAQNTDSQSADFGKVVVSYTISDEDTAEDAIPGYITPTIAYSNDGGSTWTDIASSSASLVLTSGTDGMQPIGSTDTILSAAWDAKTDLGSTYNQNMMVKLTINDHEGIFNTTTATSSLFAIDTTNPVIVSATYNGIGQNLAFHFTDEAGFQYRFSATPFTATSSTTTENAADGQWQNATASVDSSMNWIVTSTSTSPVIYVQVRDSYGNMTEKNIVVPMAPGRVDFKDTSVGENPSEVINWPAYASINNAQFRQYDLYRASDDGIFSIVGGPFTNYKISYYFDTNLFASSTYTYKVAVTDTDGDVSLYSASISDLPDGRGSSDSLPPIISAVTYPVVQSMWATIKWDTDEEADSTVDYGTTNTYGSIKSDDAMVKKHEVTLGNLLPNTDYFFKVTSKDSGNNAASDDNGSAGYLFTTPGGPIISSVTASSSDKTATVSWNTDKDSDSHIFYSKDRGFNGYKEVVGSLIGGPTSTVVYAHSLSLVDLDPGSTYYYYVQSTTAEGNASLDNNGGSYYSFQTSADVYPPIISGIATPIRTSQSVVIFWKTNEPATSQVHYGDTASSTNTSSDYDSTLSIYHSVTVDNLVANTTYFYNVTSLDAAGNTAVSTTTTFITAKEGEVKIITIGGGGAGAGQFSTPPEVKDTVPPAITNLEVATTTAFSATITFETSEPAVSSLDYGKTDIYGDTAGEKNYATTHTMKLNGLKMGTEYHFQVQSRDKASNAVTSEDKTFKTKFFSQTGSELTSLENIQQYEQQVDQSIESILPGIFPPFVETPSVTDITENSATVTWRTNIKAYGVVSYGTDDEFGKASSSSTAYTEEVSNTNTKTIDHTLNLLGLIPNTKYHFKVKSFSLPQVVGEGKDTTFTTKTPKVSASIIDIKNTSFRVIWSTDQVASTIVEYKNTKTGITERIIDDKQVAYHDILVDRAVPAATYEVRVFGYTGAGALIESGAALSVLTSRDVSAPKISNFKVDGALVPGRTDRVQTVITWTTDEPSNSAIFYQEGAGAVAGAFANKSEQLDTYTTNHAIILSNLKPGTIYQMKVESSDQAGNKGSFGPRTIITPQKGESIFDVIFKNFEDTFKFLRSAGQ